MTIRERVLLAIAPKATPAEERKILARLALMTPEERTAKQRQWDKQFAEHARSVLRDVADSL